MTINPGSLMMDADFVQGSANSIVGALNTIANTLSGLALGWDGTSAREARDFAQQWKNAMTGLFGTPDDPMTGVINQLMIALAKAAGNFSNAELAITNMFVQLIAALGNISPPGSDNTSPIPPGTTITDPKSSAVSETSWSAIP
jgi:uncharacterized protein YukE